MFDNWGDIGGVQGCKISRLYIRPYLTKNVHLCNTENQPFCNYL